MQACSVSAQSLKGDLAGQCLINFQLAGMQQLLLDLKVNVDSIPVLHRSHHI